MNSLVEKAFQEYKEALQLDHENTDAIFFILEEIGNEYELSEAAFNELCREIEGRI